MAGEVRPSLPPAIFVVGATCSGKSEIGRFLSTSGYMWIEPSKYVKEHIPIDIPLIDRLRAVDKFFQKEGADYVAKRLIAEVLDAPFRPLVVTGCRQLVERDVLAEKFRTAVIALHSSTRTRFERATSRARKDVAPDFATFVQASAWEYSLGLGRLIWEADAILENEGSLEELQARLMRISFLELRQ